MLNLNDLKNEITIIAPEHPVFIYVGVGAAATFGAERILPSENYQQFPPFLQHMRNSIPKLHMFLLLIDPQHENPPRIATDYALKDAYNSQCHYRNAEGTFHAYVYRYMVYTEADVQHREGALDITPTLRELNTFAKENRVSFLYHDFSGRRTGLLAEYFDQENREHLDQIVYGLSAREDHGCYFNLLEPRAYFPIRLDESDPNQRPIVKMFNYYKYSVNQNYQASLRELAAYPIEMRSLAEIQKKQIIQILYTQFKNINLSILRQIRKTFIDVEQAQAQAEQEQAQSQAEQEQAEYIFKELPYHLRKIFTELFKAKNYTLLYELLFNYSARELDTMAKLKEMDMTGTEILSFITLNEDPYKWYNTIKEIIP
jgi:hypothetical protein